MTTLRLLLSESNDPWFNLAVEECIYRQMPATQKVLFLWRNAETVVIGRAQNPWKECNTRRMAQDGIKLARRSSGGGAVFHDLGNCCFTFMAGKPEYDKSVSTGIILQALSRLGIEAEPSGRNDIVVRRGEEMRKISGSAYHETPDRGFHHGTFLINADLSRLAGYLNPDIKKLQTKGITSVRSRVANLTEIAPAINYAAICDAVTEAFFDYYQARCQPERISPQALPDLPGFAEQFARQSSWEWNFGHSPDFSHLLDTRFAWGGVEIHFDVERGVISRCQIFSDSLNPAPLEALATQLQGVAYRPDALAAAVARLQTAYPTQHEELAQLKSWLTASVS